MYVLDIRLSKWPLHKTNTYIGADGLGNPKKNALRTCQAKFLQDMVNKLQVDGKFEGHGLWWCDSLCIPVGDQCKEYCNMAIRNMGRTYQGATKVLALDNSLLQCSKIAPAVELYIRLKLSAWMRRLWTLQEGVLAKDVCVQLSDGTRTLREIDETMKVGGYSDLQFLYTRYSLLSRTFFGPFIRGPTRAVNQRLIGLWKAVQWRSTSKRADETVCLATLFGLDPGPILDISEETGDRRMIQLLRMLQMIPLLLLFQPPPRLRQSGFRWAPNTFLNYFRMERTEPFRAINEVGNIAHEGNGFVLSRAALEIDVLVSVPLLIGTDFNISLELEDTCCMFYVTYVYPADKQAENPDGSRALKKPAIIPDRPVSSGDRGGHLGYLLIF